MSYSMKCNVSVHRMSRFRKVYCFPSKLVSGSDFFHEDHQNNSLTMFMIKQKKEWMKQSAQLE